MKNVMLKKSKLFFLIILFCSKLFCNESVFLDNLILDQADSGELSRGIREPNHFVIITPSYNNAGFMKVPGRADMRVCDFNLTTIINQENGPFTWEVKYIDDKSPDGTGYFVKDFLKRHGFEHKFDVQINETRKLALQNLWEAINTCKDEDVVIILDGDDGFSNCNVLKYLDKVYQDKNIWITYGQYRELISSNLGFNAPMPDHIVKNNAFRQHPTLPTHLRTFKAWLAKRINPEHLKVTPELAQRINTGNSNYTGQYFPMTYDMALMLPMMEMACLGHFKFISEVLYSYNDNNPISDHRVNKNLQRQIDLYIRSLPIYQPL